ncbi:hypothetical protein KQH29_00315 [bacterium]|nr:hypothetical protein [bacterium]
MPNHLESLLSEDTLQAILASPPRDQLHPVRWLLQNDRKGMRQEYVNTNRALDWILRSDQPWVDRQLPRLSSTVNYEEVAGALGEIRAYGYMLEAGIIVEPVHESDESTPDFEIEEKSAQVEVNTKQMHEATARELDRFNQGQPGSEDESFKFLRDKEREIGGRIIVIDPCGRPEPGENVAENVISKICGIKARETQFSDTRPSILWLDFQGEHWHLHNMVDQVNPINTWNGEFYAGAVWYGLYGWKGAPIFEHASPDWQPPTSIVAMRHDGRFRAGTKVDAVVLSCPRHTVVLENPFSVKPISSELWTKTICLPWFRYEASYPRWPSDDLAQVIELQKERIESLSQQMDEND